jgi:hypothetical protein
MAQTVLGELNVHLLCYPGVDRSQRSGFAAQIELCGGRVRRFSREVTHVVVLRPFNAAEADIAAGDAELRKVFDKIEQVRELNSTICNTKLWSNDSMHYDTATANSM